MTQITTTTQPGDIVVIVPQWIIRAVGFLALFCGLSLSFLVFAAGYVMEGAVSAVLSIGCVPVWMLIHYILWRWHWYLVLISMLMSGTLCAASLLLGMRVPMSIARSQFGDLPAVANFITISPANGLVALVLAALITAVVYRIYRLWRSGGGVVAPAPTAPPPTAEDLFDDAPMPAVAIDHSLAGQVLRKLERTGRKGEIRGDTIFAYKGGHLVAIVRLIDRAGSISPLLVKDVAKQRDRQGIKTAYLATSGSFSADVRVLAGQLGIQLMVV